MFWNLGAWQHVYNRSNLFSYISINYIVRLILCVLLLIGRLRSPAPYLGGLPAARAPYIGSFGHPQQPSYGYQQGLMYSPYGWATYYAHNESSRIWKLEWAGWVCIHFIGGLWGNEPKEEQVWKIMLMSNLCSLTYWMLYNHSLHFVWEPTI